MQAARIFGATSGIYDTAVLGLNLETFIVQVITFVLALLVLQRFAVKPIIKKLQERRDTIEKGVADAEQVKKDRAAMEAETAEALQKARAQADKIIDDARQTGRQTIKEAEDAAKEKADRMVQRAHKQIEQDQARARKQLEGEIAGLVSEATEAVVAEKVDAKKDAALIERALKENAR